MAVGVQDRLVEVESVEAPAASGCRWQRRRRSARMTLIRCC